jgi:hypothetical protein
LPSGAWTFPTSLAKAALPQAHLSAHHVKYKDIFAAAVIAVENSTRRFHDLPISARGLAKFRRKGTAFGMCLQLFNVLEDTLDQFARQ